MVVGQPQPMMMQQPMMMAPQPMMMQQPMPTTIVIQNGDRDHSHHSDDDEPPRAYGRTPMRIKCPNCSQKVTTDIEKKTSSKQWMFCCLLGMFTSCCCLPFCIDSCWNIEHKCPNCQNVAGTNEAA